MTGQAILYDGVDDAMSRTVELDSVVDSKLGIFSCWVRIDGLDGVERGIFECDNEKVRVRLTAGNVVQFHLEDGAPAAQFVSSSTHTTSATYFHVLSSWDVENDIVQLYIDDVDVTVQQAPDPTIDVNIAYDTPFWTVGAARDLTKKFQGAMSDFYFQPGEFLDFSVEANRRKFRTEFGNPVELGSAAQLPTGASAAVYFPADRGNPSDNAGSGGDFVVLSVQVIGETEGPSVEFAVMDGVGSLQAEGASVIGATGLGTLVGVGEFQAEAGFAEDGFYVPKAILFDGTTDFMFKFQPLTNAVDGKRGLASLWFRIDGGNDTERNLFGNLNNSLDLRLSLTNELVLTCRSPAPSTEVLRLTHNLNLQAGPTWYHYMASWDLGLLKASAYLDESIQTTVDTIVDDDVDYDGTTDWVLGARTFAGNFKFPGAIADYYFADEYLDLDIETNRRNFIDFSGDPRFLGTTGDRPTGTSAWFYLRGELTDQGFNSGSSDDLPSQAVQVPNETTGPVADAIGALAGVGGLQLEVVAEAILEGVGGLQAEGTIGEIEGATMAGVGALQAEGFSQGAIGANLAGVGAFQSVATFIGAVSEANLRGVGSMEVRAVNQNFGVPNEEALVCDPALDSSSPGSGVLPRSWNGL